MRARPGLIAGLAVALLLAAAQTARPSHLDPPRPARLAPTGDCAYDNIFYGAVPPGGEGAPVLLFVHGLSGIASDWWTSQTTAGENDMYLQAYHAGYRTAFVNTNIDAAQEGCAVERRPGIGVWAAGEVLARQIARVAEQYRVAQLTVVAHSKGGLDTQAALVGAGAAPLVERVFTLSTPHQGSILADALWSPEGFWLSVLLGQRDAATYSLRTDQAQAFRAVADASSADDAVAYYSAAGSFWDTPGTLYALTGEWLQEQLGGGDNDGVVTVDSTALQGATTLFVRPWNHAEITLGRNSFPLIEAVLRAEPPTAVPTATSRPSPTATSRPSPTAAALMHLPLLAGGPERGRALTQGPAAAGGGAPSGLILRGGELGAATELTLPIEPLARSARFTLLASGPLGATLIGPDGGQAGLSLRQLGGHPLLAGAWGGSELAREPAAGAWRLRLEGPPGTAYLLLAAIDSPLRVSLTGAGPELRAAAQGPGGPQVRGVELRALPDSAAAGRPEPLLARGGWRLQIAGPRPEPYTASVTVRGATADGQAFERAFIRVLP